MFPIYSTYMPTSNVNADFGSPAVNATMPTTYTRLSGVPSPSASSTLSHVKHVVSNVPSHPNNP